MLNFTGSFTLFRMTKIVFYVIPLRGMTAAVIQYERKRSCCLTLRVIPNVVRNPVISCLLKQAIVSN